MSLTAMSLLIPAPAPWNPFSVWSGSIRVQVSGEASYRESDMPGSNGSRMYATTIQGQNYSDAYVTVPCSNFYAVNDTYLPAAAGSPSYSMSSLYDTCQRFDLWTT